MAELFISYINPIRFRPVGGNDDMPRIDKMENGEQYYKGIYPLPNYTADWLLGEEIVIQIQTDLSQADAVLLILRAFTPSGAITEVNSVDVTPSGWLVNGAAGRVLNFLYTPPSSGDYHFNTFKKGPSIIPQQYTSDVFKVRTNDIDLVEIQYEDSKNSFDGVFFDNSVSIWQPKAYFTGIAIAGTPKSNSSIYTDDPDIPVRTRSTTQRTIDLSLTDITRNHYSQLIDIFNCDTNYVNSQKAMNIDELDTEDVDKSDATSIILNMIRIEDNNFVKNT